jgi:ribosomal protein S6E (S10)
MWRRRKIRWSGGENRRGSEMKNDGKGPERVREPAKE